MTLSKEIFLVTFHNTIEEMKVAERSIEDRTAPVPVLKHYCYLQNYWNNMNDLNELQTLVVGDKNLVESLVLLGRRLGVKPSYRIVTIDVLVKKKYERYLKDEFIFAIEQEIKPLPSIDDILDKINLVGVKNLSELDYAVLKYY